jgi:hypothetical protein
LAQLRRSAHVIRRFREQGSIQDVNHTPKFAPIEGSVKWHPGCRGHLLCFDHRRRSHAGNPFRPPHPARPRLPGAQDRKTPASPRGPGSGPSNNGVGYCADKK